MSNNTTKNFLIPGAILLGFIILAAGIVWAFNAYTFRVATIDMNKIIKDSSLGQEANKELQAKGNQLKAKLMTAKTDVEKAQINNEFQKYQADQQAAFFDKVKTATAEVAKQSGIKAVSSPQLFIYSDKDLTNAVIDKLDK